MPEEVDIALLQSQLTAICTDPLWLDSGTLCAEFDAALDSAAAELAGGALYDAAIGLSDLLDRVEAEQQQMHSNAYWMLYHNIHQAYANLADAGPSSLGVGCGSSSVERADSVPCGPLLPIPPIGSTSEVTGWRFVGGPSGEFVITPPGGLPGTWEGPLVVGGTVWVNADVDGVPDSAGTAMEATPRSWPAPPMDDPVLELSDTSQSFDLPSIPTSATDLVHFHSAFYLNGDWGSTDLHPTILSGPNRTLSYNDEPILIRYGPFYEINRDALTNKQNDWYKSHPQNNQTDENGDPICRRQDLETIVLTSVEDRATEAVTAVRNYWPQSTVHMDLEGIVSAGGLEGVTDANIDTLVAEFGVIRGVLDQLPPYSPPCVLLF